jgi:hypothetical protein
MLLWADRNFLGYRLWTAAAATGAELLWRAKNNLHLPLRQALPDGSYLSTLIDPTDARRVRHNTNRNRNRGHNPPKPRPLAGVTVRIIEATITVTIGGTTRTERYRLVTTLLDHHLAPPGRSPTPTPAAGPPRPGSKTSKPCSCKDAHYAQTPPCGPTRKIWAALIVYQTLTLLTAHAALTRDLDPARISFTAARDAAQNTITTTPRQAPRHTEELYADLCHQLITKHTTFRLNPRAVKKTPPATPTPARPGS